LPEKPQGLKQKNDPVKDINMPGADDFFGERPHRESLGDQTGEQCVRSNPIGFMTRGAPLQFRLKTLEILEKSLQKNAPGFGGSVFQNRLEERLVLFRSA